MDVAARIKELRELRGYTTNKLAKLSGLSQSTLRDIESEGKQPTIPTLAAICDGLGITLADFFDTEKAEIPDHIKVLVRTVSDFTPEQVNQLTEFVRSVRGK
ncbi:MAG: helix-turn-helix domain-containing protein [Solirubrobacterales bacterium]